MLLLLLLLLLLQSAALDQALKATMPLDHLSRMNIHTVLLILTYFRAACCECQHTFVVTFANLEDRDYYLDTDPAHLDFKQFVLASGVSKGVVMDFDENQFQF